MALGRRVFSFATSPVRAHSGYTSLTTGRQYHSIPKEVISERSKDVKENGRVVWVENEVR